jgi:hypothetical protein
MDDDLKQLEAELQRLRPAAPSKALEARVARDLAAPAPSVARRPRAAVHWLWSAALPIAAALAVVALLPGQRRERTNADSSTAPRMASVSIGATPGSSALKPVAAENVLYSAQDEGLVTLEDGTTARRERLNYVDTITWKNPRTNASLTWTVPREEVRVVPVNFQ